MTTMRDNQLGEDLARARGRYSEALPILWNPPSVVGVAIGQRVRGGETIEDEVCFVVYVREKKRSDLTRWEALPKELFGVPVDVQVAEGAPLERRTGIGGRIWGDGRKGHETGTLGLLARGAGGQPYALTAMHVLHEDRVGHQITGLPVWASTSRGDRRIGVVEDGRLEPFCDIALIRIEDDAQILDELARWVVSAGAPLRDITPRPGLPVELAVKLADGRRPRGKVLAGSYTGLCKTDQPGDMKFVDLIRFGFDTAVKPGWSGGLIFCDDGGRRCPVAFLSFGDDSKNIGFGWPMAGFFEHWKLSPWAG